MHQLRAPRRLERLPSNRSASVSAEAVFKFSPREPQPGGGGGGLNAEAEGGLVPLLLPPLFRLLLFLFLLPLLPPLNLPKEKLT